MKWLLAIDPGLDVSGIALYKLEPLLNVPLDTEIALNLLAPLLVDVASISSDPEKTPWLPERLNDLCSQLKEYMRRVGEVYPEVLKDVGSVIIEEPANFFNYARGGAGGPSMVKGLYHMGLASAALVMTLRSLGVRPIFVKADNTRRDVKQAFADRLWQRAGKPVNLRRPGNAINDDARSAVWLGAFRLLGRAPTRTPPKPKARKKKAENQGGFVADLPAVIS